MLTTAAPVACSEAPSPPPSTRPDPPVTQRRRHRRFPGRRRPSVVGRRGCDRRPTQLARRWCPSPSRSRRRYSRHCAGSSTGGCYRRSLHSRSPAGWEGLTRLCWHRPGLDVREPYSCGGWSGRRPVWLCRLRMYLLPGGRRTAAAAAARWPRRARPRRARRRPQAARAVPGTRRARGGCARARAAARRSGRAAAAARGGARRCAPPPRRVRWPAEAQGLGSGAGLRGWAQGLGSGAGGHPVALRRGPDRAELGPELADCRCRLVRREGNGDGSFRRRERGGLEGRGRLWTMNHLRRVSSE